MPAMITTTVPITLTAAPTIIPPRTVMAVMATTVTATTITATAVPNSTTKAAAT